MQFSGLDFLHNSNFNCTIVSCKFLNLGDAGLIYEI
jgi:hypothetical protein